MEKCEELLPDYYCFVNGLVDSPDLSLNISREILQHDRQLKIIAKSLEKKINTELKNLLKEDRENYEKFFTAFGRQLKYGTYSDFGMNKENLQDLLLFYSSLTKKQSTLDEYVQRMKEEQKAIYYACGETVEKIDMLPQVEKVKEKGYEIFYATDSIDEFVFQTMIEYNGKSFKNVSSDDLDLDTAEEKEAIQKENEENKDLLNIMKETLKDEIQEVKFTNRLKNHPVCLTTEGGISIEMEKVINSMPADQKVKAKIVLEINDSHPISNKLKELYNTDKEEVKKEKFTVDWDVSAAEKGGYEHFMMKEIEEQPKAIRDTISPRIKDGKIVLDDISLTEEDIKNINKIYIVACGSAYHVGVVGKYVIEKMCRIPVEVQVASEFRYCDPIVGKDDLVIVISQSGETADTKAALEEAKARGARVLSIVNVVGSAIAKASDDVIYTWAGPEIAVATTKAYSTQLTVIYLIAAYMADKLGKISKEEYADFIKEIESLPDKVAEILKSKEDVQYLASKFYNCHSIFFIGRNLDYAVSLEGSLKLKEISYIHSEAYAAGELKHGTISLIEDGTLVVALATGKNLFDKTVSNVKEVKARGAVVMGVTTEEHEHMDDVADYTVKIPATHEMLLPSLTVIPLQLFGYYVASLKGCDIDKPRNLAKSVTVE